MAENYGKSAVRHMRDASFLMDQGRLESAAHLMGFSGECAIKYAITIINGPVEIPKKHFPSLIEAAKKSLSSRRGRDMLIVLKDPRLMQGWSVDDRYSDDGHVAIEDLQLWKNQTQRLLHASQLGRLV